MRLSVTGSREAFAALVERHAVRVHGLCAQFVRDAHLGQELAQDTWAQVWQQRKHYRGGAFKAWLITVARNRCRNHVRHRKVVERHQRIPDAKEQSLQPEQIDRLLREERQGRVQAAVQELPVKLREALLLRYAQELPYEEMAKVLDASPGTLRSRVHHALAALRKQLGRET
ncbi:MAG: RNA polymerase sigma factor [Myxococcales bacterium]|nr:RNA polymerase sigma factor [Myxococcales bacterium]MDD9965116.1 RNA polymerase sigma factor [Myxococcales bacterium]